MQYKYKYIYTYTAMSMTYIYASYLIMTPAPKFQRQLVFSKVE